MLFLHVNNGSEAGRRIALPASEHASVIMGRSMESDFPVPDEQISSHHCEIAIEADILQIRDLGSRNGTFVNEQKVIDWHPLREDDQLRVGETEFEVRKDSQANGEGESIPQPWKTTNTRLTRSHAPDGPESCPRCGRAFSPEELAGKKVRRISRYVFCLPCIEGEPSAGTRLKNLTLLYELGRGATGTVYRAHHELLGMDVAAKILHPRFQHDPTQRTRFFQEARIGVSLVHPNLLRIHDVDLENDRLFLVTEFIQGEDLRSRIERTGPLPLEEAIPLGIKIAQALHFGHSHGVIHRDVKPGNILLDERNEPRLADFNIAHVLEAAGDPASTPAGTVLGTLRYMAPEQFDTHRKIDHRSDLYSLGATLFHAVTGSPPFTTSNRIHLLREVALAPPPIASERNPEIPASLDRILETALAKDPADRFPNGSALAEALAYVG